MHVAAAAVAAAIALSPDYRQLMRSERKVGGWSFRRQGCREDPAEGQRKSASASTWALQWDRCATHRSHSMRPIHLNILTIPILRDRLDTRQDLRMDSRHVPILTSSRPMPHSNCMSERVTLIVGCGRSAQAGGAGILTEAKAG